MSEEYNADWRRVDGKPVSTGPGGRGMMFCKDCKWSILGFWHDDLFCLLPNMVTGEIKIIPPEVKNRTSESHQWLLHNAKRCRENRRSEICGPGALLYEQKNEEPL